MLRRLHRIFLPHAGIADVLQAQFGLPRRPACRTQHGRFEITVRGAGLSTQSVEHCVAVAESMAAAVRPLLEDSHRRITRRAAHYALRVTFEDERLVANGVATTSLSYVATVRHGTESVERRLWHPARWV